MVLKKARSENGTVSESKNGSGRNLKDLSQM